MIERHTPRGPQSKVCKRPSCKVPFVRTPNMKQSTWDKLEYCTRHRGSVPPEPKLGLYIVNNPTLDAYLCGKL